MKFDQNQFIAFFREVGLSLLFTIRLRVNISPTIFCVWVHAWLDMHKITQQKISIWFKTTATELGLVEKIVSLQRNKIGIRIRSIGFYNFINLNRIILEIYFLILHCIKYLIQGSWLNLFDSSVLSIKIWESYGIAKIYFLIYISQMEDGRRMIFSFLLSFLLEWATS